MLFLWQTWLADCKRLGSLLRTIMKPWVEMVKCLLSLASQVLKSQLFWKLSLVGLKQHVILLCNRHLAPLLRSLGLSGAIYQIIRKGGKGAARPVKNEVIAFKIEPFLNEQKSWIKKMFRLIKLSRHLKKWSDEWHISRTNEKLPISRRKSRPHICGCIIFCPYCDIYNLFSPTFFD